MSKRVELDWGALLDNMPTKRKFNKGDRVKVFRHTGEFLAKGTILGWQYDRSEKVYDYLVQSLDGERRTYFEEPQLQPDDNMLAHTVFFPDEDDFRAEQFKILCSEVEPIIHHLSAVYLTFETGTPQPVIDSIGRDFFKFLDSLYHSHPIDVGTVTMSREKYIQCLASVDSKPTNYYLLKEAPH